MVNELQRLKNLKNEVAYQRKQQKMKIYEWNDLMEKFFKIRRLFSKSQVFPHCWIEILIVGDAIKIVLNRESASSHGAETVTLQKRTAYQPYRVNVPEKLKHHPEIKRIMKAYNCQNAWEINVRRSSCSSFDKKDENVLMRLEFPLVGQSCDIYDRNQ